MTSDTLDMPRYVYVPWLPLHHQMQHTKRSSPFWMSHVAHLNESCRTYAVFCLLSFVFCGYAELILVCWLRWCICAITPLASSYYMCHDSPCHIICAMTPQVSSHICSALLRVCRAPFAGSDDATGVMAHTIICKGIHSTYKYTPKGALHTCTRALHMCCLWRCKGGLHY